MTLGSIGPSANSNNYLSSGRLWLIVGHSELDFHAVHSSFKFITTVLVCMYPIHPYTVSSWIIDKVGGSGRHMRHEQGNRDCKMYRVGDDCRVVRCMQQCSNESSPS